MKRKTVEIQKELLNRKTSILKKYQQLIIGKMDLFSLIKYEVIILLSSWVPGALGLVLRMKLYPLLMGKVGNRVYFGQNVVLRHPHKIRVGDDVIIDDNVILDAKGYDNDGISIGNGVFIGRGTIFNCKNGNIILGDYVNMGFNCHIVSANQVNLGNNALIAANCYLIGGTLKSNRPDMIPVEQERESKGIELKENIWLGANVQVMDGVMIGHDSIVGTSAVVNSDIPDNSIAVGIPAKVIKRKGESY